MKQGRDLVTSTVVFIYFILLFYFIISWAKSRRFQQPQQLQDMWTSIPKIPMLAILSTKL